MLLGKLNFMCAVPFNSRRKWRGLCCCIKRRDLSPKCSVYMNVCVCVWCSCVGVFYYCTNGLMAMIAFIFMFVIVAEVFCVRCERLWPLIPCFILVRLFNLFDSLSFSFLPPFVTIRYQSPACPPPFSVSFSCPFFLFFLRPFPHSSNILVVSFLPNSTTASTCTERVSMIKTCKNLPKCFPGISLSVNWSESFF